VNEKAIMGVAGPALARAAPHQACAIVRVLAAGSRPVAISPARCLSERVNVIVIEVRPGRDGKKYPPGGDLPPAERNRARKLAHNLICRDKLSIRAAQRVMLEQYAVRRSLGIIHRDLQRFECPSCRD